MSSDETQNYPTFVDLGATHMAVSPNNQPMAITVYVDQSASGINDSDSTEAIIKEQVKSPVEDDLFENDASATDEINHVWVKEEVELLFKLYKTRQKEINDPHRKKRDIWIEIATELKTYGFNPTPKQCDRKLRNMKATYIKTLERMKKGDNSSTCQYYDELYDIYGWSPPLQTPPRLLLPKKSRPLPLTKNEYRNGNTNFVTSAENDSYEPAAKKYAFQNSDQRMIGTQKQELGQGLSSPIILPFQKEKSVSPSTLGDQLLQNQTTLAELQEELKATKKALEVEKEAREAERKSFEEERREFHKERMSMLESINKLIGNIQQKVV